MGKGILEDLWLATIETLNRNGKSNSQVPPLGQIPHHGERRHLPKSALMGGRSRTPPRALVNPQPRPTPPSSRPHPTSTDQLPHPIKFGANEINRTRKLVPLRSSRQTYHTRTTQYQENLYQIQTDNNGELKSIRRPT